MQPKEDQLYIAGTVFTPSVPVSSRDLFSGRIDKITSVINAITQPGQHAIIYGERGVGKTSLANVIHAFLPSGAGILSIRINCDAGMDFETLFKTILFEIKLEYTKPGTGFRAEEETEIKTLDEFINKERGINPNELRLLFKQLTSKTIIIIDEFDRLEDQASKKLLADTIKNFSDYNVDTTFILVGVADSVDALINEHQSTERALAQIQMPRMSIQELEMIVSKGLSKMGLKIEQTAKDRIIRLSQGLPHYTHLLALNATQNALTNGRSTVTLEDVRVSTDKAIQETQQSVRDSYYNAINSPKGNLYTQVLLACALAKNNEIGFFAATDVKAPLSRILGKTYDISAFARHLKEFCERERGPILKRTGYSRRFRYRFVNPLMEPFVIMKGLSSGMVKDADLD